MITETITVTKRFGPYPFAHSQHNHDGHCRLIHGHNWYFELTFSCPKHQLDENGFIVDFGKFEELKENFKRLFDHTFVVSAFHDQISKFRSLHKEGLLCLIEVYSASCEGLCSVVTNEVENFLLVPAYQSRGVRLVSVKVEEDEKNSATLICQNVE